MLFFRKEKGPPALGACQALIAAQGLGSVLQQAVSRSIS
jgi:hypothetical protein